MKAKKVHESLTFKRGEDPNDALGVGDGRSIEELVNIEIDKAHPLMKDIQFDDIKNVVYDLINNGGSTFDIWDMLMDTVDSLSVERQVKWWIYHLPY